MSRIEACSREIACSTHENNHKTEFHAEKRRVSKEQSAQYALARWFRAQLEAFREICGVIRSIDAHFAAKYRRLWLLPSDVKSIEGDRGGSPDALWAEEPIRSRWEGNSPEGRRKTWIGANPKWWIVSNAIIAIIICILQSSESKRSSIESLAAISRTLGECAASKRVWSKAKHRSDLLRTCLPAFGLWAGFSLSRDRTRKRRRDTIEPPERADLCTSSEFVWLAIIPAHRRAKAKHISWNEREASGEATDSSSLSMNGLARCHLFRLMGGFLFEESCRARACW